MKYEKVFLYEDREDVTLTEYLLDDSVEMLNGNKRGAVLVCPGGAYLYCSDREGEPIALRFAAMGYHTFVLRYSVYNENKGQNTMDNILPDMSAPWQEKENILYPAQLHDIGKAMLYIREHADEWLLDKDKIAVCGFSAGAYTCAMYAVNYNRPIVTDYLGIGAEGIRPSAVILGYTLSDYTEFLNVDMEDSPLFSASICAYTGKKTLTDRELAEELSPYLHVTEQTPPMFLWTTAEDQLVDAEQTLKMALALNRHHVPYELHVFEKGQHGMSLGTYATAAGAFHLDGRIADWADMADKWLQTRMAPEFPEIHHGF